MVSLWFGLAPTLAAVFVPVSFKYKTTGLEISDSQFFLEPFSGKLTLIGVTLLVRFDKYAENFLGLIQLACGLLWYRRLHRLNAP